MIKAFISYHHANDQWAKDELQALSLRYGLFEDQSVNTSDIEDDLPTEVIRCRIRDEYLRDSTVTIVLVGTDTKGRKHVDWEIYSSMRDGPLNKRSGILAIQLPITNPSCWFAAHEWEKTNIYPECDSWISLDTFAEYQSRHPYLPDRIIDNLIEPDAKISVTNWDRVVNNPSNLLALIQAAHDDRLTNRYDLSRDLRRSNSPRY